MINLQIMYMNVIATSRTTKNWSVRTGSTWIVINWDYIVNSPYSIRRSTSCWTVHREEPYLVEKETITTPIDSIVQLNLSEWSLCIFRIAVVFNPATLDRGIQINASTSMFVRLHSASIALFSHYWSN